MQRSQDQFPESSPQEDGADYFNDEKLQDEPDLFDETENDREFESGEEDEERQLILK